MRWAVLKITDGTKTIDLLGGVIRVQDWAPAIAEPKGGGVWKDSPLSDGRSMVYRKFNNPIETFTCTLTADTQERVIRETQDLRDLLEQAVSYWTARVLTAGPVWIEARGQMETNSRYAVIMDYRTPADGNPYSAQFTPLSRLFAFPKWTLIIERGHWLSDPPGTSACLPVSFSQSGYTYAGNLVANGSFETAGGGGADVFANWTETAGDGAIAASAASPFHLTKSAQLSAGPTMNTQLQQNVGVAASTTYTLSVWVKGSNAVRSGRIRVLDITHGWDLVTATAVYASNTTDYFHYSVMITTPAGCVSLGIILLCPALNGAVANFDYVTLRRTTPLTVGRTDTCLAEVPITNKSTKVQLTDIYVYDASAGTFGSNLLGAALPYNLFPNPAATGDMVYFGVDVGALYAGPFSNLILDLSTAAGGTLSVVYEYYDSVSGWKGFLVDQENTFGDWSSTYTGVRYMDFKQLSTWTPTTVNGVFAWWIRVRITSAGPFSQPKQQNRQPYTANKPYVLVDSAQILGGLPALMRTRIKQLSANTYTQDMILYTRSLARGARFDPHINLADMERDPEFTIDLGGSVSYVALSGSPTGRAARYSPVGVMTMGIAMTINIASPLSDSYHGTFRIFLRSDQGGGTLGDFTGYLAVTETGTVTGPTVTLSSGMADLGQFTIPVLDLGSTYSDQITLELYLACSNPAPGYLNMIDLIFVPVDECAVMVEGKSAIYSILTADRYIELDSTYPRQAITALTGSSTTGKPIGRAGYNTISVGPMMLQPGEDQLVGILSLNSSGSEMIFYPQFWHVDRYLSMRGDR